MAERISVKRASELTGLSPEYIRLGILKGVLPIGTAIQAGEARTNYHISPYLLAQYLGLTVEQVKGEKHV